MPIHFLTYIIVGTAVFIAGFVDAIAGDCLPIMPLPPTRCHQPAEQLFQQSALSRMA